jgi:transposase
MFQDEARFGRSNHIKSCWAPFPARPTVLRQFVREHIYIFGAVSPCDGRHDSLILPWANSEAMSLFLGEVRHRYQDEFILMFMDRAGWHNSKSLRIPINMKLAFLPPYSPELNPQEQIWDELREKYFGNKLFENLEAVIDSAVQGLQCLENSPSTVAKLTKRNWINPY